MRLFCAPCVLRWMRSPDTHAVDVTHSPVTGNHGTHEFFLHVRFGGYSFPPVKDEAIVAAVSRALALPKYRK